MSLLQLPEPDQKILARRDVIVAGLRRIVPGEGVISEEDECRVYESDGLTAYRQLPLAVVLPSTTDEVSAVLKNEVHVIFCVGESLVQRERNETRGAVEAQLKVGLEGLTASDFE